MTVIKSRTFLMAAVLTSQAGLSSAAEAPATAAKLDACLKAVSVLGASMGYTEVKSTDGRSVLKFRLRTSGLDYVAECDPETGSIGDVSPHYPDPNDGAS